jgi:hypothetical protein
MDECEWTSCRALARLDLIAGAAPSASRVVGSFCVPHASMASLDIQEEAGEPTWYDWHRERADTRAAAASAYEASAAVIPLFHQRAQRVTAEDAERPDALIASGDARAALSRPAPR